VENLQGGLRINGFGSGRLAMGMFERPDIGRCTQYCYTQNPQAVVLTVEGRILVLNAVDEAETKALYESILKAMPEK